MSALSEARFKLKELAEHPATTKSEVKAIYMILSALADFETLIWFYAEAEGHDSVAKRLVDKYSIRK